MDPESTLTIRVQQYMKNIYGTKENKVSPQHKTKILKENIAKQEHCKNKTKISQSQNTLKQNVIKLNTSKDKRK